MAEYPHWFVVVCTVLAVTLGLWIVMKLIKAALWLFLVVFLFLAGSAAVYYLVR